MSEESAPSDRRDELRDRDAQGSAELGENASDTGSDGAPTRGRKRKAVLSAAELRQKSFEYSQNRRLARERYARAAQGPQNADSGATATPEAASGIISLAPALIASYKLVL